MVTNPVCGCLPITKANQIWQAEQIASAVPLTEHVWRQDAEPGTYAWDAVFEEILDRRIRLCESYAEIGFCLFPWQILRHLNARHKLTDRFYWNQGSVPSCSMHGACHSAQASVLVDLAFGAPRVYDALNPIYPFYIARGENLGGGLDLAATANQLNRFGTYAVSDVGADNISAPRDWREYSDRALRRQAAVIYLEHDLVEKIFRACRAGFHVTFGSVTWFKEGTIDRNGVKTLTGTGYGGHAQSLGSWRKVGGTEYVFLTNSWGDAYGTGDEEEPACGGWLNRDKVAVLAESMPRYGAPFIALYENPVRAKDAKLLGSLTVPFPENFRRE
ncbi:MAG: hypothetical protein ACOX6D_02605 [Thermoguttaceae bacterium]